MMHKGLVLVLAALIACSGGGADQGSVPTKGAETAGDAVRDLAEALRAGEFGVAAAYAVPGQAALMALAEGATFSQVVTALDQGDGEVAANFWTGFAQGAGSVLIDPFTVEIEQEVDEGGVRFSRVVVTPEGASPRVLYVRDVDGYRVDLFASFGAALAGRIQATGEALLNSANPEALRILEALGEVVPSLLVASRDPELDPSQSQGLFQLIEMITRVG